LNRSEVLSIFQTRVSPSLADQIYNQTGPSLATFFELLKHPDPLAAISSKIMELQTDIRYCSSNVTAITDAVNLPFSFELETIQVCLLNANILQFQANKLLKIHDRVAQTALEFFLGHKR
jgi:hypothetical protein